MKDNQEIIEDMAYSICTISKHVEGCKKCGYKNRCAMIIYAKLFTEVGYRKVNDIIDEFVHRIKQHHFDFDKDSLIDWTGTTYEVSIEDIEKIAEEMKKNK